MSAFAQRALIVTFPPDPCLRERVTSVRQLFSAGKIKTGPVLLSGHRAFLLLKFEGIATLTHTAWYIPTCWVRRWSGGPAATVLPR